MTAPTVTLPVESGKGDAAAAPKKSKKKLIIIIVAVVLVAGVGAKMTVLKKKPGKVVPKPGAVVALDDVDINLAGSHFLKLAMTLQLIKGKDATPPDGGAASDIANTYFTGKTQAVVMSPAGKAAAKKAILAQIEAQPEYKGVVMDIYFPDYVTQ